MAGYIGSKSSVVLNAGATAEQGALADTAVQPNDSVTLGAVTATSFVGDGSGLTGLPAGGDTIHLLGGAYVSTTAYVTYTGLSGLKAFRLDGEQVYASVVRPYYISYYNGSTWDADTTAVTTSTGDGDQNIFVHGTTTTIFSQTGTTRTGSVAKAAPANWSGFRFRGPGTSGLAFMVTAITSG